MFERTIHETREEDHIHCDKLSCLISSPFLLTEMTEMTNTTQYETKHSEMYNKGPDDFFSYIHFTK